MRLEAMAHVLWQRRMEEEAAQRCQLALAITFFAALASSARLRLDRPSPLPTLAPALLSRNLPAGLACLARPRRRSSRRVGGRARPQFLLAALARRCGAPAPPPSHESDASLHTKAHSPGPEIARQPSDSQTLLSSRAAPSTGARRVPRTRARLAAARARPHRQGAARASARDTDGAAARRQLARPLSPPAGRGVAALPPLRRAAAALQGHSQSVGSY